MIAFKVAVVMAIALGLGVTAWVISRLMPNQEMLNIILLGLGGLGVSRLLERM
jgi:hypothetical protein